MHANKPEMAKKWEKEEESVNESSYTQRSILDFIKANKAAVESDPANIPRIKLFGPKQDSKYLNISLIGLAKIAKIVKNESVNEAKKMRFTKDGKRIISKSVWLRMPDYAKLRKNGVEHVLSIDPKKKGRSKYIPVQIESVNEAAKAKAGDYVKTIAGIAQIEKVRGSIAYMKLPGKKTKGYWMNDLKFLKSTGKMEKGKPLWTEGFGGELKGKDREKFEKARKENAEQLGYKLTGKSDIRESWNQLRTNLMSILKRKQHQKIDGVLVDMQTANLILKVWDALNSSNRKKFEKLSIKKMADVAWKLMK